MKCFNIYDMSNIYEQEANLFTAQLLIPDEEFLDYAHMGYTAYQMASELNIHEELILLKGMILNKQGYGLNIPYIPDAKYLGKK